MRNDAVTVLVVDLYLSKPIAPEKLEAMLYNMLPKELVHGGMQ